MCINEQHKHPRIVVVVVVVVWRFLVVSLSKLLRVLVPARFLLRPQRIYLIIS